MSRRVVAILVGVAFCVGVAAAWPWDKKVSVATAPPVVVSTVPQAGDLGVDPALSEIRVTFSKEMRGSWSWVSVSSNTVPKFTGKARFLDDRRTCVAPVRLEPGHTYAIAFNSEKDQGFQDGEGRAALPYLLVFETRSEAGGDNGK